MTRPPARRTAAGLLFAFALLPLLVPRVAASQQPDSTGPRAGAALRMVGDSTRMRARRLTYVLTRTADTATVQLGERMVELRAAQYGDVAAWSLVERMRGPMIPAGEDSLLLRRGDLTPLRWQSLLGSSRLAAEFARDTMYAALQAPGTRRSITAGIPPGVVASAGALERWLEIVTLDEQWVGVVDLLLIDLSGAHVVEGTLSVEGTASVQAPAGEWECWRVVLRAAGAEKRFWVRKADALVVRTHQLLPNSGGHSLESLLVAEEPILDLPVVPAVPVDTAGAPSRSPAQSPPMNER